MASNCSNVAKSCGSTDTNVIATSGTHLSPAASRTGMRTACTSSQKPGGPTSGVAKGSLSRRRRRASQWPAMTVSASSELVWLSGRGRLLTPHHSWRPRTCPIRIACGLIEECAPWRLGGRECRHRCEDRKCNDRLSHVLLLLKPDRHWKLIAMASIVVKWLRFAVPVARPGAL